MGLTKKDIEMKKIKLLLILMFFAFNNLDAQEKKKDSLFDESSKTFLPIPLIINNPTIDTGFGAMAMYFFKFDKEDKDSPPSRANLLGLYSTNKSYFFIASSFLYWNEDKNRATIIAGPLRINHDAEYEVENAGNVHLVYSEYRTIYSFEYSRKIAGNFYIGALYLGANTNYKFEEGSDEDQDFTEEFFEENDIEGGFISSIGLNFSFDSLDYLYNPTKGLSFSVRPKINREWLGSDNDYTDTDFNFKYFIPLSVGNILGFSLAGGVSWGDVPFDGYQSFGVRNNLRGYPGGKYRGEHMVAFQTEYRKHIYNRWGAVVFAGTGSVWSKEDEEIETFQKTWLPSAGIGARYMISREKKINLRLDFAVGVDGNQGVYFGVMEAF